MLWAVSASTSQIFFSNTTEVWLRSQSRVWLESVGLTIGRRWTKEEQWLKEVSEFFPHAWMYRMLDLRIITWLCIICVQLVISTTRQVCCCLATFPSSVSSYDPQIRPYLRHNQFHVWEHQELGVPNNDNHCQTVKVKHSWGAVGTADWKTLKKPQSVI